MTHIPIFPLLLGFVLFGCNAKEQRSVPVTPAPSSKEALVRALDAMKQRDSNALLSLVSGGSKAQNFFASVIDSLKAMDSFRGKFIDAYGEDAWNAFQAPLQEGQKRPNMNLTMPDLSQIQTSASEWQANDDNKGVFEALPGMPLPFKEIDGGWVIDGTGVFNDDRILVGYTDTQQKLTEFIERYEKAIGHKGIGPEDIDYQMGKDFLIVLMGGELKVGGKSPNPDRFKLNEL
jgi:hypothetical protein